MQAGGGEMYFGYGETELQYLRSRDKRMGEVIDRVGMIRREVDPDLFAAVVHHIVGQQISTKAQATVWRRMQEVLGTVDAGSVLRPTLRTLPSEFRAEPSTRRRCGRAAMRRPSGSCVP